MLSNVDRVKERLDIIDVIGTYVKLEKAGKSFKARSPFTNEKTPSFFVSPEKQLFYCFSSGKGGDMFNFVQEVEGVDFKGALKILADKAGIELVNESNHQKDEQDRLFDALTDATVFFESNLSKNSTANEYLKKRGIVKETITRWKIGYAPAEWRSLKQYLIGKGYKEQELLRAGLIKISEKGESYDVFRGRIIFPIFDVSNRVVGFSGRILVPDEKSPKYLNSPDSELYNKSKVLFGLNVAKVPIRKLDYAVLVEGQMDLVMSHQAGVSNTVAGSGTAITEAHLGILKKISNRIIIAFDSDRAGFTAAERSAEIALSLGIEVKAVLLPPGSDPADLILKDPKLWKEALRSASHIIDFYVDNLLLSQKNSRSLGRDIVSQILPKLALIKSSVEQSHFISSISKKTGIPEEALWEDLKKVVSQKNPVFNKGKSKNESNIITPILSKEDLVLGLLFSEDPLIDKASVQKEIERIVGVDYMARITNLDDLEREKIVFKAQAFIDARGAPLKKEDVAHAIREFEIHVLKDRSEEINRFRVDAEKKGEVEKAQELLKENLEIRKKIDKLTLNH